ncbi:MAG TPA: hypothetical protein DEQ02_07675 [Ruminococcaceae bacterium]|nr:hypothetical protein [Oscillospiraceae bacterium]
MLSLALIVLPFLAIFLSVLVGLRAMNKTKSAKQAMKRHFIVLIFSLALIFAFTMFASAASASSAAPDEEAPNAETSAAQTVSSDTGAASGMGFIAAALCTGLAGIGAGIALSSSAPAAIGAVSEDPKAFGKAIIFVALGEAVAIYGFVISILIWIKLPSFA